MFWASAFVAIRHLGHDFSPGSLSLGRLLVGSVCLAVVALSRDVLRPTRREILPIVLIGVLWFGVYNVALNAGEERVDAGTAAMLIQVSPVLIALLAAMFLSERFTDPPRDRPGPGLRRRGADRVRDISHDGSGNGDVIGVLLCLVSAVAYSISLILQKPLVRRISAVQITWMACTIGAISCLPFAGDLVDAGTGRARVVDLVAGLPRGVPDRDRLQHLRVRAQAHEREQPRRDDLPGATDHHRDGRDLPQRGTAHDGVRRRGARPGRCGRRPSQARGPSRPVCPAPEAAALHT